MRGDAAKVAEQLRRRMIRYAVAVVVFSALVYTIVRLYEYEVATGAL